jgi:Flp pilus assembly protein TadB
MLERIIGSVVIFILLVIVVRYWYLDFSKRRKQRKRFERGAQKEEEARNFLIKKGYKIIDEQFDAIHRYKVDGEFEEVKLIVDYVVSKAGKTYLVEVKSGKSAIYIKNKNTRRQILEYDYAIENDGIFLLDMENEEMHLIEFVPKENRSNSRNGIGVVIIILLSFVGILVTDWYVKSVVLLLLFIVLAYKLYQYQNNK